MARAPRASVSKTSGQGISRLSYQKGRKLGNTGAQAIAKVDTPDVKSTRSYGKSEGKYPSGINVSYGDTIEPGDLEDVRKLSELQMMKPQVSNKRQPGKKLK